MIQIPLEIGDIILAGRFKNKKIKVNEIGIDDFGSPTINGRSILKIRIPKLYQKQENEMKTNKNNINENASKYFQYIKMADSYGWENVFDVLQKAGYNTMSYRVSSVPSEGSPAVNLKTTTPTMKNDIVVEKVYEDTKDGGIVVKTNKAFLKFWNNNMKESKQLKENLSPDKLKTIDKKIEWSTEKNLPFSQGFAIKEVIKRYKIPAIKWGYVGTGQFIGVETNKQKMFWRDKGSELQFLGILNKDGSVAENKNMKEAVNPFQKSPLEVKIKQTDGSWHIYLQTVDGEECLTMTGWGTKEQAEHAAMTKGYSFDANKSNETPTRDTPKYTGYEKVRSEKPEEMKLSKEKTIEIKLESMMREILGKKKALIEADVTDNPDLEAKARRYAEIANKMKQLEAELKAMEPEFEQLDNEFRPLLENIGKTKDTFIRAGKLLIKIERAGYDKNSASYKTGFEYLYKKVNGTMKDLADEALAMTKTVSYVKSKISVVQGESNINEENWLTKIKSFLTNKFKKIFNLNNSANAELSKLEKMV